MKILSATIVRLQNHPDKVYLHTDQPSPTPKIDEDKLSLGFVCERKYTETYLRINFPNLSEIEIVHD